MEQVRRSSSINTSRIDPLISEYSNIKEKKLHLHYSDLLDSSSLTALINSIKPDEVYNLAAQSHVAVSFKTRYTQPTLEQMEPSLLEAIKHSDKDIKFYQASSSEMYGGTTTEKLNENSKFEPKSPYAAAKVFSHEINKIYRDSYGMFCTNGIFV